MISLLFWIASAFFTVSFRNDTTGSTELRGGSIEIWTKTQKEAQRQSSEQFEREPPWTVRWAWPIDRGHTVEKNSPEFARGESIGWHPLRNPEMFFRPWMTRSNNSWFIRAPLWLIVLPLGLLVVLLRLLHVRSPFVPRCENCNYSLAGIADGECVVCPECGREQLPTTG